MHSTTEAENVDLSKDMRDIFPFVGLVKGIEFVIKLQGFTTTVMYSIIEKPVTVHENNQGGIVLAVSSQTQPHTKHTMIKYHHFRSFFANDGVEVQHIDTKEHIWIFYQDARF